ncbi:MAG: cyclic nucleotide-binding/CBS domain-containing protein [Myxococcaceae bacterium]
MASIEKYVIRTVIGLDAAAPCREAAMLMAKHRIGAVAVQQDNRVVGLVTERDLATRVIARGLGNDTPIAEAMRRDLPAIPYSVTEVECATRMKEHETRHLLVEEDGQPVGIISMRDVIQMMLEDKQFLIEQMQGYIQGY